MNLHTCEMLYNLSFMSYFSFSLDFLINSAVSVEVLFGRFLMEIIRNNKPTEKLSQIVFFVLPVGYTVFLTVSGHFQSSLLLSPFTQSVLNKTLTLPRVARKDNLHKTYFYNCIHFIKTRRERGNRLKLFLNYKLSKNKRVHISGFSPAALC